MLAILIAAIVFGFFHWLLSKLQGVSASVVLAVAFLLALLVYHYRDLVLGWL